MREILQAQQPDIEVEIIRKGGGLFEIERNGALVFSKKALGRFPEDSEIKALIG